MKRPISSDSLCALLPISSVDGDERDFQTMLLALDDEDCGQLSVSEKKRRLGADQVRALERSFEVENKLEPERKAKLAEELGLQPRQVAVWFQNRRARWKTKRLEKDYGLLRADHDELSRRFETLEKENQSLLNEIRELKSKLNNEDDDSKIRIKTEPSLASDTDHQEKGNLDANDEAYLELNNKEVIIGCATPAFSDLKDGVLSSDDSDSSAILNNEDINTNSPHDQFLDIENEPSPSKYSLDMNFEFSDCKASAFVKIEEHSFLDEESCSSLFSDDQAPTLHWYCSDEWK